MLMLARVQAIQARQVLRGTVGELVKETRKQEAEGVFSHRLVLQRFPGLSSSHVLHW